MIGVDCIVCSSSLSVPCTTLFAFVAFGFDFRNGHYSGSDVSCDPSLPSRSTLLVQDYELFKIKLNKFIGDMYPNL